MKTKLTALSVFVAFLAGCPGSPLNLGSNNGTGGSSTSSTASGTTSSTGGGGTSTTGGCDPAGAGGATATIACTVDVEDIEVSSGVNPGSSIAAAVAWGGDHYAVAWNSNEDPSEVRIHVAVLDKNGSNKVEAIVDDGPGATVGIAGTPTVVWLPSGEYQVFWRDALKQRIRTRHVAVDGTPLGNVADLMPAKGNDPLEPVAWEMSGKVFLAWEDSLGVAVASVEGDTLGASPLYLEGAKKPALSGRDGTMGLVWEWGKEVGFLRFSDLSAPSKPIFFGEDPVGSPNRPRLAAHGGGEFSVTWEDYLDTDDSTVVYSRINAEDAASEWSSIAPQNIGAGIPDAVWAGAHPAVVYYQFRLTDPKPGIYLSLIHPCEDKPLNDLLVSATKAKYPRMAWGNDRLAVVFAEVSGHVRMSLVSCK